MHIPIALSGALLGFLYWNRPPARLFMGDCGSLFIGALSGILISPITTIYYDTGFLIGLKGFVGAILGGMASYPLAVVGSVALGLLEAYASFWSSAFKETIVFAIIIPPLIWLSLRSRHVEEDEEEE